MDLRKLLKIKVVRKRRLDCQMYYCMKPLR